MVYDAKLIHTHKNQTKQHVRAKLMKMFSLHQSILPLPNTISNSQKITLDPSHENWVV